MFCGSDAFAESRCGTRSLVDVHGVVIAGAMRKIGDVCSIIAMVPSNRVAARDPLRKRWLCHRPQSLTGRSGALAEAAPDVTTSRIQRRLGGAFVCPAALVIYSTGWSPHSVHACAP